MTSECLNGYGGQGDCPAALGCLRGKVLVDPVDALEGPQHRYGTRVEVDSIPGQAERLALPETDGKSHCDESLQAIPINRSKQLRGLFGVEVSNLNAFRGRRLREGCHVALGKSPAHGLIQRRAEDTASVLSCARRVIVALDEEDNVGTDLATSPSATNWTGSLPGVCFGRMNQPSDASSPIASSPDAPSVPGGSVRSRLVADAIKTWTAQLVDLGGRNNNLLHYRDLRLSTLDIGGTAAAPAALRLLRGGRLRLSDLYPDPELRKQAAARARALLARARENREERGIETLFLAQGLAT